VGLHFCVYLSAFVNSFWSTGLSDLSKKKETKGYASPGSKKIDLKGIETRMVGFRLVISELWAYYSVSSP